MLGKISGANKVIESNIFLGHLSSLNEISKFGRFVKRGSDNFVKTTPKINGILYLKKLRLRECFEQLWG